MDRAREQLISLAMGDLSAAEADRMNAALAADPALQAEYQGLLQRLVVLRSVPADDVPQSVVDRLVRSAVLTDEIPGAEQLAPVISIRTALAVYLPRVAAAAAMVLLVGLTMVYLPEGPPRSVATVTDADGHRSYISQGEMVEARFGSPLRVRTASAELLLDGGSAISFAGMSTHDIIVDRGRVVVDATHAAAQVKVGAETLRVEQGSVVAIERDREHARILNGGEMVEIQRTSIERVLPLARAEYGLALDDRELPEAVKRQRVTFFGTQLDAEAFRRGFSLALADFGVGIRGDRLVYSPGTPYRVGLGDEPEVVSVTMLHGRAELEGAGRHVLLGGERGVESATLTRQGVLPQGAGAYDRSCVWALGMGNAVVDARLANVRAADTTLPAGVLIYPDRVILPEGEERVFLLDGPDFNFPLPGGRKARLVGVLSSGVELEFEDSPIRVFVPHSRIAHND